MYSFPTWMQASRNIYSVDIFCWPGLSVMESAAMKSSYKCISLTFVIWFTMKKCWHQILEMDISNIVSISWNKLISMPMLSIPIYFICCSMCVYVCICKNILKIGFYRRKMRRRVTTRTTQIMNPHLLISKCGITFNSVVGYMCYFTLFPFTFVWYVCYIRSSGRRRRGPFKTIKFGTNIDLSDDKK